MKRYCRTLTLADDPQLVDAYLEAHRHVWPEVVEGQRRVGILRMQLWHRDRSLTMIMDTTDAFDPDRDLARLALLPRQAEWEAHVARFQGCDTRASSAQKWAPMELIFDSVEK